MEIIKWEVVAENTIYGEVDSYEYMYDIFVKRHSIEGWYGEVRVIKQADLYPNYTTKDTTALLMYDGFASVEEAMQKCQRVVTNHLNKKYSVIDQLKRKVMLFYKE